MVGPLERPSRVPGSLSILESAVASRRERTTDGATPHRFPAVQRASTPLLDGSARLTPLLIQRASAPPKRSVARPAAVGSPVPVPCDRPEIRPVRRNSPERPPRPHYSASAFALRDRPADRRRSRYRRSSNSSGVESSRRSRRPGGSRVAARGLPRILESLLEAYGNPSIGASVKTDRVRRRRPRSPKIRDSVTPFGLRHRLPESALRMRYASSASSPASSVTVTQK